MIVVLLTGLYFILAFYSNVNIFGFISIISLSIIFYTEKSFLKKVFNLYLTIFSITIIPSLFIYILISIGFDLPSFTIEPLNPLKVYHYAQYLFLVIPQKLNILFPRFCGYYDEPGVVGTIAGVLLIVKGFNIKDKINIPILLAGILSFSFYFYLLLAIYIIVFAKMKFKIVLISLCILILPALYFNEILYELIFKRFSFQDGSFIGINRTVSSFDAWYESFKHSRDFFWGLGKGGSLEYNLGGASYKDIIVNFGIIYFIIYMGAFSFFGFMYLRLTKPYLIYLLILFSVIYQRPFITSMFYLFLIFVPIYSLNEEKSLIPSTNE